LQSHDQQQKHVEREFVQIAAAAAFAKEGWVMKWVFYKKDATSWLKAGDY
jgi:hypothetical protein